MWYDFYQTSGGAISRTSEERASEWYHTNTSLIKSYHNVTHVITSYHVTRVIGPIYAISRTSEERASEWYHTNTSLIKLYHNVTHVIIFFIIYHNTRTNRNFVHTYHSHIYYISTHCHFLTLQITVCLSCQTQQAMHNALCDVLWPKNIIKKIQIL